jgi:hypothetical protein
MEIPFGQTRHAKQAVLLGSGWNRPAGHFWHAPAPVDGWYSPGTHERHEADPVLLYMPAVHTSQAVLPPKLENWPWKQMSHAAAPTPL